MSSSLKELSAEQKPRKMGRLGQVVEGGGKSLLFAIGNYPLILKRRIFFMMLIQWFVGGLGTSLSCGQFALANLLASQEHLMTLISPRIRHIDRKRGEGLSFEKKGCSGPPFAAF